MATRQPPALRLLRKVSPAADRETLSQHSALFCHAEARTLNSLSESLAAGDPDAAFFFFFPVHHMEGSLLGSRTFAAVDRGKGGHEVSTLEGCPEPTSIFSRLPFPDSARHGCSLRTSVLQ